MSNRCNLRCDGCYYYEGEKQFAVENDSVEAWQHLMRDEKKRGITYVVLAGAEPSLVPELLEVFFQEIPLGSIATNGLKKISESVGYKIHISVWGNDETSFRVRKAKDLLKKQIENYRNDPRAVFVYTFTHENIDEVREVAERLVAEDCRLTFNVFSSPVGYAGPLRHDGESLKRVQAAMMALLEHYPQNVLFSAYNAVAHTHEKSLHGLYSCLYPRQNPSELGLGRSFRQYRTDLKWDRAAACSVCRIRIVPIAVIVSVLGSAVVTARLFRHARRRLLFSPVGLCRHLFGGLGDGVSQRGESLLESGQPSRDLALSRKNREKTDPLKESLHEDRKFIAGSKMG